MIIRLKESVTEEMQKARQIAEFYYRRGAFAGGKPSSGAVRAVEFFRRNQIVDILDLGCGVGRELAYFAEQGFRCTGIDFCLSALEQAEERLVERGLEARLIEGDLFSGILKGETFDGIYAIHFFQLFDARQRQKLALLLPGLLRDKGKIVALALSTEDRYFREFSPHPGEPNGRLDPEGYALYFFDRQTWYDFVAFNRLEILELELYDLTEEHDERGWHTHRMWWAVMGRK